MLQTDGGFKREGKVMGKPIRISPTKSWVLSEDEYKALCLHCLMGIPERSNYVCDHNAIKTVERKVILALQKKGLLDHLPEQDDVFA